MALYNIGDVAVTPNTVVNPYTYQGETSIGAGRVKALKAAERGDLRKLNLQLWFAPSGGGAKCIYPSDVNWEDSGLDLYDDNGNLLPRRGGH